MKSRKAYIILFGFGGVLMILSAVFSTGDVSSYRFPLNASFVAIACFVLLIEAVLVWRLSIRAGRKAVV